MDRVLVDESREHLEVEDEHEEVAAVREVFEDEGLDALVEEVGQVVERVLHRLHLANGGVHDLEMVSLSLSINSLTCW